MHRCIDVFNFFIFLDIYKYILINNINNNISIHISSNRIESICILRSCIFVITKDDLLRYKYIKAEIESLKEDIHELENLSVGVASYSETRSNLNAMPSKIESNVERVYLLRERYYKRLYAILELKIKIEDAVSKLPYNERMVLREYYLNGLNWYEVSDKLFISLSWCHKLHNRALKMLSVH